MLCKNLINNFDYLNKFCHSFSKYDAIFFMNLLFYMQYFDSELCNVLQCLKINSHDGLACKDIKSIIYIKFTNKRNWFTEIVIILPLSCYNLIVEFHIELKLPTPKDFCVTPLSL